MDFALKTGCPMVGINDSGGARIQEGVVALGLYAEIFKRNTHASGVIPQISLVMGPAAGGAVYSPAITDFIVMVDKTSHMFITGPDVIKTVTGEDVGFEELGGARTHNAKSGVAHYLGSDEEDAIDHVKALLSYLPSNNLDDPPVYDAEADLATNDGDLELDDLDPRLPEPAVRHAPPSWSTSSTTASSSRCRRCSHRTSSWASVASRGARSASSPTSPCSSPGASTSTRRRRPRGSCAPATRSTSPCSPSSTCPASSPAPTRSGGIIRRGAKLLYAYAEATVPLVTVITRKAYGGAYDVMGSKHLGADINLAWPTAQIAVMGAQGAVNILYRKEIAEATEAGTVEARRAELITEYEDTLANPYVACERGYVDAVILPSETRGQIVRALRALRTKRASLPPKKHGNIPL